MEQVAIIPLKNYNLSGIKAVFKNAFGCFGGIGGFIKPGEKVLLKPNLIAAFNADGAVTHPLFVEAAIELVKEQDALPHVGDSPAFGSAKGVAKACGLLDAVQRQGIPIVEFSKNVTTGNHVSVTKSVKDFDKIINIPKLKAHGQVMFSGAVKNLFGLTRGKIKAWRHFAVRNDIEQFCLMILKIYKQVLPAFTLVDAVDIMEVTGPRGGRMRHYGFVFSGLNCISIDRVIAECLGLDTSQAPLLDTAEKHGYPGIHLYDIRIVGEPMEKVLIDDFVFPERLSNISFEFKGVIKSLFEHLWRLHVKEKLND